MPESIIRRCFRASAIAFAWHRKNSDPLSATTTTILLFYYKTNADHKLRLTLASPGKYWAHAQLFIFALLQKSKSLSRQNIFCRLMLT